MMADTVRFLTLAILFSLALFGAAAFLTGCAEVRTLYHACKDGNCG